MFNQDDKQYKELLEAIKPFFPNSPLLAYTLITERVGPIFNNFLLQLLWKQLELEYSPDWTKTIPYEVFIHRFSMN